MSDESTAGVEEVVRRLVSFYQPERIYLFGSAARGDSGPANDLDFLVVSPDDAPRELLISGKEYEVLRGIPIPVDVVSFRRASFEARKNWVMALPAIVTRDGRLVYDSRLAHRPEVAPDRRPC